MLESAFQKKVIRELKDEYPGCVIMKNDANYIQGIPDIIILYKKKWAMIECKRFKDASHRPNQDYWVQRLNKMSFARFIYPENKTEVMNELRRYFKRK